MIGPGKFWSWQCTNKAAAHLQVSKAHLPKVVVDSPASERATRINTDY